MTTSRVAVQLGKEEVFASSAELRRSPRNLPQHLKEKLEQPRPEREPDIKTLPSIIFNGRIQYVDDFFKCAQICDDLIQAVKHNQKEFVPVGFDLEWPFNFQTGSGKTALVQICLEDSVCYLLYIYSLKKLPAAFVELLCHSKVKLVGVNVKNDVWKLGRDFKEFPAQKVVENNCLDCGTYANKVLKRSCRWSLERLTAYLLRKKISKDPEVRMSKWHIQPLSNAQKNYAATDAYKALANRHHQHSDETANTLVLLEHEPVYTVGIRNKRYTEKDESKLRSFGAEFWRTNRGGLITFHGPGQLVAYPVLDLKQFHTSIRWYVQQVERMVIRVCAEFGIKAETSPDTGVWVGDRKICAIGIHGSRYITTHGLALNCNTDLKWFDHIVPCGIEGKGVTSISRELDMNVTFLDVLPIFRNAFSDQFECELIEYPLGEASQLLRDARRST